MALVVFPTSCASALGASAPPSSLFSSKVFPENFFSHSSSDQTVATKGKVRAQELTQRARAQLLHGAPSMPEDVLFPSSPGLDDPSLILMGLARFTLIVLPKSSDSFCRGEKSTAKPTQRYKTTVPPKALQSSEDTASALSGAHSTQGSKATHPQGTGSRSGSRVPTMLSIAAAASCQKKKKQNQNKIIINIYSQGPA